MKNSFRVAALWAAVTLLAAQGAAWAQQVQNFGSPTQLPALNSPIVFSRTLSTSNSECPLCTAQIMSLVMDLKNDSTKSTLFPWPLYIQLTTNHDRGDAVGAYARMISSGAGWSAGLHTEALHSGTGTSIGTNIEQSNLSGRGRVIGLNIQAKNGFSGLGKNRWSDEAINIQSDSSAGWKTGLKFNQVSLEKGIAFDTESSGKTAIDVAGRFERGVDLHGNSLFLGRGGKIVLDEEEKVELSFNKQLRQIEIRSGDELVANFPLAKKTKQVVPTPPGAMH